MKNKSQNKSFRRRHLGPREFQIKQLLEKIGLQKLDQLIDEAIPASIVSSDWQKNRKPVDETDLLKSLKDISAKNKVFRSYIGMGYSGTKTPGVILRNILENPGWYTQYTPYQAEISQGRLEALLNFQTLISDLTGLDISNASLLDEGTAAAEAMAMIYRNVRNDEKNTFFVDENVHPQTLSILETRSNPLGINLVVGSPADVALNETFFGAILQYPGSDGAVIDHKAWIQKATQQNIITVMAVDILSLVLLTPPGELGADIAIGSSQRFGVPMGYGGPHAAFMACSELFKRKIPGRIIGVSRDRNDRLALRMALQTREQHIRREKATSNICTAQVLLAIMSSMYDVYHGPEGLKQIAIEVHALTVALAEKFNAFGFSLEHQAFFDTLKINMAVDQQKTIRKKAEDGQLNFRYFDNGAIGISLDEETTSDDINDILASFSIEDKIDQMEGDFNSPIPGSLIRNSDFLAHPVFNSYHSETEMLRYINRLEAKDLSLTTSMIPLGSCTMKLNATTEMAPVTWPEFASLHPFAPRDQAEGYSIILEDLENWLKDLTGFTGVSLQPNSGAQGEFTGLMLIRAYHSDRNESQRNICLIPASAHGTNPASATMAGMNVIVVKCDEKGNIDVADLKEKSEKHNNTLAAFMVTYPSTHGVFEESIKDICDIIHTNGGMVYMDGANLNAMVGLCKPADFGADVMHINLHKTFSIPHGGGGPGMGPICCVDDLAHYLPTHPVIPVGGSRGISAVSAAPWGSASILIISWAYMTLMGIEGLKKASQIAILNANYMANKLGKHFSILYTGAKGRVAHEFILDLRPLRKTSGIADEDVAKRLMDYGFHAPTMSFPVPGTLMIEPTESESVAELDRYCDALISIKNEIISIADGKMDRNDNVLKMAPHTAEEVSSDNWSHPYSREMAAYPVARLKNFKFWPSVSRINNALGDRNLICSCPPIEDYEDQE